MRSVVDRKIGIEMCPFANYQIRGFVPMKNINVNYPLMNYLKMGALVSVNTDNIGISNANISDNYLFLSELCPDISRMDVLQLIRNAIETAFIPSEFRIKLISQFSDQIFHSVLKKSQ
jgi:adenosine deaminase